MKSDFYKEYIAPVVVLVAICLVITLALALTYGVSNPVIEANAKKNADAARMELLPDAGSFTQVEGDLYQASAKVYVTEAYTAENGGAVISVDTASFGGAMNMMVGIDSEGKVTQIKIMDHADTPGVGTKNWDGNNIVGGGRTEMQFGGVSELTASNIKADKNIQQITGASVSGGAIYEGVKCALEQYKSIGGAN